MVYNRMILVIAHESQSGSYYEGAMELILLRASFSKILELRMENTVCQKKDVRELEHLGYPHSSLN